MSIIRTSEEEGAASRPLPLMMATKISLTTAAQSINSAPHSTTHAGWRAALLRIAGHYRIGASPEQLRLGELWSGNDLQVRDLARHIGLLVEEVDANVDLLSGIRLPLVVEMTGGAIGVIETENAEGFQIALCSDNGLQTSVDREMLRQLMVRLYAVKPAASVPDRRIDEYLAPYRPDWLRQILFEDLRPYSGIVLASFVANFLALAGVIFSMQVYDRVVPSGSMPTLYVLFGGVVLAAAFSYLMRVARIRIIDITGKTADVRVSDKVFGHAIRVRNIERPRSTGTFITQIRELEHLRDMMTSTTVSAIADVPFFLLFCALFFYIAPTLVWIPLVSVVLLVAPGLFAQRRLRLLAEENMRESSLRSAMLVEAVQGMDDIKSMQAETRFGNLWNHYNEVTAESGLRLRELVNSLATWAATVQTTMFAVVVFFGAPLVIAGDITTGALIAASMLGSRMMALLSSVSQLLTRWQQAKVARESIDKLLELPVDAPDNERRIHKPFVRGSYRLRNAVFGHAKDVPVLKIRQIDIAPGERIAILGPNGSGKSTLLNGLAGLLEPLSGEIRLDEVELGLIDPADVRRDVVHLGQNARLFHGTLRENVLLGAPKARDEEILALLSDLRLSDYVQRLPEGLDHNLQEGGLGLSGGQRQGLLLARLLLRRPQLALLDEPTAALDNVAENAVIDALAALPAHTGLVVATHRPAMLRIVDRIILLNGGTVMLDGPKDEVLAKLRAEGVAS